MNYEKEKKTAFLFSKYAPMYSYMSKTRKEQINRELENLDLTTLGFLLEMCPFECTEFVLLIEDSYARRLSHNGYQFTFMKECLSYKRKNLENEKLDRKITKDTYNTGKHCDKFNRRKNLKKAKGKAFAKIRVKEVIFY